MQLPGHRGGITVGPAEKFPLMLRHQETWHMCPGAHRWGHSTASWGTALGTSSLHLSPITHLTRQRLTGLFSPPGWDTLGHRAEGLVAWAQQLVTDKCALQSRWYPASTV